MADTKIQWTNKTWNPTTGCDLCYALTLAKRLKSMGSAKYQTDGHPATSGPGFGLAVHPSTLAAPAKWGGRQLVFVNSMSDLFHAKVPLGFVRDVFDVVRETPQHTYQVLTKRSLRLRRVADQLDWPANLWMGVSVENADYLNRVDDLRAVPAAVRFLSCEPLLGPLDLGEFLDGVLTEWSRPDYPVHWVILGGESGRGARRMQLGWAQQVVAQCRTAGVPVFVKQLGSAWGPGHHGRTDDQWAAWPAGLRVREWPAVVP